MKQTLPPDDVTVFPCTGHHIGLLHEIGVRSYEANYLYLWTDLRYAHWYMDRSFGTDSLRKQMASAGSHFFLVYQGSEAAGMLKLNIGKSYLDRHSTDVELEKIYLLKEMSGKGLGRRVVDWVFQHASEQGNNCVWLKSMDSSPSVKFYQRCGFAIVGRERLPFEGFKDEFRNMVIMEKCLHT